MTDVSNILQELSKSVLTEFCEVMQNQSVFLDGQCLVWSKPDLCIIDQSRSVAFIVEVSNPFDLFIENCYRHKFHKYMPLCLQLSEVGISTRIVVFTIGS